VYLTHVFLLNSTHGRQRAISQLLGTLPPIKLLGAHISVNVDIVCKSSHFHLRALRHIRKHISADTTKTIACSMVDGRLDYCNSVLYGTSAMNLNKLQRVQNSAARIVTGSRRLEHARMPLLAELHWLPIKQYNTRSPLQRSRS